MLPMTAVEEDKDEGEDGQGKQEKDPELSASGAATEPKVLTCPIHGKESQLSHYCRNCEVLVCARCLQEQHLQCPENGKVPVQEYAREEREGIKRCRVKYAQVMRFFTEQRRDTEERLAALNVRKNSVQGEVRKFFSALLKACMDVEGSLLEELENSVADHMDMLTEQNQAWKELQDSTQELLDITDVLHFLPTADFLPLMEASKSLLSQALREGETLTGATPPEMSMELCLAQSSQRSVVKRIKEIGATALNITTHKTLTLRKVTGMSLCTADDKTDPLVTSMTLLTPTMLLAADFNNSCLKRFQKEEEMPGSSGTESWNCTEILPLKWKPYGMTKLTEEVVVAYPDESSPAHRAENEQGSGILYNHSPLPLEDIGDVSTKAEERPETEIRLAVTSPLAGCFEVVVPTSPSSNRRMRVMRAILEEKGFWGLGLVSDHKLALSTVASGRSYISLLDTSDSSTKGDAATAQRLALTSDTSLMPVVSPRHILPTDSASFIVGDHGKNAIIHASMDGKVLFTFTGNGSQRVSCPEGLCMDSLQGHIYVADSGDHSIFVLTKGGHLYSKTRSQQNDLSFPQAVCIDRNSRLYVANDGGKLLAVYEMFQES